MASRIARGPGRGDLYVGDVMHGLKNVGETTANYFVLAIGRDTPGSQTRNAQCRRLGGTLAVCSRNIGRIRSHIKTWRRTRRTWSS